MTKHQEQILLVATLRSDLREAKQTQEFLAAERDRFRTETVALTAQLSRLEQVVNVMRATLQIDYRG